MGDFGIYCCLKIHVSSNLELVLLHLVNLFINLSWKVAVEVIYRVSLTGPDLMIMGVESFHWIPTVMIWIRLNS